MTKKTSVLRASLTGFTGLVGVGVAVVVVAAVCLLPLPGVTAVTAPFEVTPVPGPQSRVCAGPLLQVLPQAGDATTYFAPGEVTVFSDAQGATLATRDLSPVDVAPAGSSSVPFVLSVPPAAQNEAQPLLAGIQAQRVSTEELSGLAAQACADANSDTWLVGGATDVGRTTLLLLSNPTEVTATVALEIFGDNGVVSAPGAEGILVEAGQQRVLSLASFAPDLISPVIHVTSGGGLVQASLQQSVMRGLVPGGVEVIGPSASPNTSQIMTGVSLTGLAAQDSGEKGLVTSDLEPTIRVAVPGADASDVVVTVIGETGEPSEIRTTVEGHHTLQLPFTGITDGLYTVIVTGTKPIVAGVRSVQSSATAGSVPTSETSPAPSATPAPTNFAPATPAPSDGQGFNGSPSQTTPDAAPVQTSPASAGGDFAWHSSAAPLATDTLIPVVEGPAPILSLYNPTDAAVTVTLARTGKKDVTVTVGAGKMATTTLLGTTRYTLSGAAGLYAAVTYAATGLGASIALSPTNQGGSAIKVVPR